MNQLRVFLVVSSGLLRQYAREQLQESGFRVVAEANSAEQALMRLSRVEELEPHVAIIEMDLEGRADGGAEVEEAIAGSEKIDPIVVAWCEPGENAGWSRMSAEKGATFQESVLNLLEVLTNEPDVAIDERSTNNCRELEISEDSTNRTPFKFGRELSGY
jgi:CheY-like chemotaxis protein